MSQSVAGLVDGSDEFAGFCRPIEGMHLVDIGATNEGRLFCAAARRRRTSEDDGAEGRIVCEVVACLDELLEEGGGDYVELCRVVKGYCCNCVARRCVLESMVDACPMTCR